MSRGKNRRHKFLKIFGNLRPKSLHLRHQPAEHWKDSDEMHEVMHSFPGYFKALLLEFLEHPLSRKEIEEVLRQQNPANFPEKSCYQGIL